MVLKIREATSEAKKKFNAVSANEKATSEEVNAALEEYVTAIAEDAGEQVRAEYEELKDVTDNNVLNARGIQTLTAAETKFYNDASKAGGFDEDVTWPETIWERIFDNIKKERPILNIINFMPASGKNTILRSRRKGVAVWGPLHKDMEGQLDAEFGAKEFGQLALTAFFLISNDTLDLGARWIDRYVRLCLEEAIAESWEKVIIAGDGNDKPIGLTKDLAGSVVGGVYPDKTVAGTLTFADAETMVTEFAGVLKKASTYKYEIKTGDTDAETLYRKVKGSLYLIINPVNYYDIVARVTTQNANGVFVSNLPFIAEDHIIESLEVPEDKLIAFVDGEYDATMSRPERFYEYKETFAMKRATLFAVDLLGNGMPANNDAAQVYDIDIPTP